MRLRVIFFISVFLLIAFLSCDKKEELFDLHFNETACANPWSATDNSQPGIANDDPDYQNKVRTYLEGLGIGVKVISISNDGPQSGCFSCFCSTGRRINITVGLSDKTLAMSIGFFKEN